MGVYHLMGLGRSPGTVTGPLSYLAHRYQRWDAADQQFFGRSGEVTQRQRGDKVGDVQACVLFTTSEVLDGEISSLDYIENPPGRITNGPKRDGGAMKVVLKQLLRKEWSIIGGGRDSGDLFWCQVNRRDIRSAYERIAQVVAALAGVGGQGHEMWINLTGGNNVTNFALQLAATLSGEVARFYYVQAENKVAESCVRFTAENGYWVELPVMPLALGRLSEAILEMLQDEVMSLTELHGRLYSQLYDLSGGIETEEALRDYLEPLWKQGIIAEAGNGYTTGPQWELIRPYQDILLQAGQADVTIEQLSQRVDWLEREIVAFE